MKQSRLFTTIPAMLLGIVLGVGSTPAFAVDGDPPDLFNLDGTPADPNGVVALPDDWNTLYTECDSFGDCGGIPDEFTTIKPDGIDKSIFWKGGSKDVLDISKWWHKDGSVPDKDEILHAFAAAYKNPNDVCYSSLGYDPECDDPDTRVVHYANDTFIYFGLDRYDNSGDAFAGFWFLQNDVAADPATSRFTDVHVGRNSDLPGDVLILVEYPQGSDAVPLIKAYEWDPLFLPPDNLDENGHDIGPLEMIYNSATDSTEPALCDSAGNKLACAITNEELIAGSLWPYMSKDGTTDYPLETFYEGGINITQLLGGKNLCVSSFLAETRSSRSETAQLKDFVLTGFSLCGAEIHTQIHDVDHNDITFTSIKPGNIIHDWAVVKTSGPGVIEDPEGTVNFYLYNNGFCDGSFVDSDVDVPLVGDVPDDNTATAESIGFSDLVPGIYSFHADFVSSNPDFPSSALDSEECEVITIEPYESEISTQIHEAGGHSPDIQGNTEFVGITIHDHAYVVEKTGNFPSAPTPTGNVDFLLFSTDDCTGGSTALSGALDGNGEAITGNFTPLGDTMLSYSASYAGDTNYLPSTESDCEPLIVEKYDSELRTEIHEGSGHSPDVQGTRLPVLTTFHDHAYWSETTGEPSAPIPTGDVTFELYENPTCSAPPTTNFGGISWPQSNGLDGAFEAETPLFTPSVGAFSIKATWAEDANYHGSIAACEELEIFKLDPSIVTMVKVRDLAQVSGAGPQPTGTVTFQTYRSNDCSGTAVDTVIRPLSSGGDAEQETASEQLLTVSDGVASYKVNYDGDDFYDAKLHNCEVVQFSVQ